MKKFIDTLNKVLTGLSIIAFIYFVIWSIMHCSLALFIMAMVIVGFSSYYIGEFAMEQLDKWVK
jgi:hypothetical protein